MADEGRVLVVGSSNTDMIVRVQRLPLPGETVLGGEFLTAGGGKGANQAVAAARAGARVTLVARLGADGFGEQTLAALRKEGIDTRFVSRDREARSGVALILVADSGENSIAVAAGANARLSPADVRRASRAFRRTDVMLVQLETPLPTVAAAVELAAQARVPVILNPAPAQPLDDGLLRRVSIITPNETEAGLLTGIRVSSERSALRAAEALRRRGPGTVILTMGGRGALVLSEAGRIHVPAFPVAAVDTTAAGDVFSGTLAATLAAGKSLPEAVRWASAAAALSVTRSGAQPSIPPRSRVERFLRTAARQGAMAAAPGRRGSAEPRK
jgi:ribokinase